MRTAGKKSLGSKMASKTANFCPLALPLLLVSCGFTPTSFAGPLQPQQGICEPPSRAALQIHDSFVQFTPNEGTLILTGRQAANGTITASWVPPSTQAHTGTFTLIAHPRAGGDALDGTYTTPRCTYTLHLSAVR
jgi:hypothetical protein